MTAPIDQLADILLLGPDFSDGTPEGEWGRTVALGLARRILNAGWQPPNVPPAERTLTPVACQTAPPPPAGGTPTPGGTHA